MNSLLNNTIKYIIITFMMMAPVWAMAPGDAHADMKTFHMFGTGAITGDNAPQALKTAIRNSLISGSESIVTDLLPPEVIVENFHTINEMISSHAENRFIKEYTVLAEDKNSRSYKVMVKATIDVASIKQELDNAGIAVPDGNMPEILMMISEQIPGSSQITCWWRSEDSLSRSITERIIAEILQKKGFSVLNKFAEKQASPMDDFERLSNDSMEIKVEDIPATFAESKACDLTKEGINNLAIKYGAVITLSGKVSVSEALNTIGGDKSFKAIISITAVNNLGITLATSTAEGVVVDADPVMGCRRAIVSAADSAGNDIVTKISKILKNTAKKNGSSDVIELHLGGYNFYPSFMVFRKELAMIPGVKNVKTLEMMADKAILSVRYADDGPRLASELVVKSFGKFGIQINHASQNRLDINFVPPDNTEQ